MNPGKLILCSSCRDYYLYTNRVSFFYERDWGTAALFFSIIYGYGFRNGSLSVIEVMITVIHLQTIRLKACNFAKEKVDPLI